MGKANVYRKRLRGRLVRLNSRVAAEALFTRRHLRRLRVAIITRFIVFGADELEDDLARFTLADSGAADGPMSSV